MKIKNKFWLLIFEKKQQQHLALVGCNLQHSTLKNFTEIKQPKQKKSKSSFRMLENNIKHHLHIQQFLLYALYSNLCTHIHTHLCTYIVFVIEKTRVCFSN